MAISASICSAQISSLWSKTLGPSAPRALDLMRDVGSDRTTYFLRIASFADDCSLSRLWCTDAFWGLTTMGHAMKMEHIAARARNATLGVMEWMTHPPGMDTEMYVRTALGART